MSDVIPEHYEIAQAKVAAGVWRIDFDSGKIYGSRGHAFGCRDRQGYVRIAILDPGNWRRKFDVRAHRVIWEAAHGPLAADFQINHINGDKLDNRLCNLEPVTAAQNIQHAFRIGLCRPGASNRKLTDGQILEIYRRAHDGETNDALASEFGVGRRTISVIRSGTAWTELTGHQRSTRRRRPVSLEEARRTGRCGRGHSVDENLRLLKNGSWACRACANENARRWRDRRSSTASLATVGSSTASVW